MTEAELDRRLFNGEAVEAALELFAENQRLLSSEPSEDERETRRRVAGAAFDMGASIADKRDAEIARLRAEVERLTWERDDARAEVMRRDRALAAGPAALRAKLPVDELPGVWDLIAQAVEAAQEAAMKEGK